LETHWVAEIATLVIGTLGNNKMVRNGLGKTLSNLAVPGRVFDTRRQTTPGLNGQHDFYRLGAGNVAGSEFLD